MSDPEDDGPFAAAEDAFKRTTALPRNKPRKEDFVCPLGSDNYDWFVYDNLCNAGIAVELIELDDTEGGCRYVAAQIVDELDLNSAMQKATSPENIFLCNAEEMLGLQVKLNAAHKWKLTIVNENMPQHPIASRPVRGRASSAVKSTTFENRRFYEIAVEVPDTDQIRCTTATAQNVTINVAFQQEKRAGSTESRWNADNSLPYIAQRRIDVAFANKLTYEVQVCARSERRN